MTDEELKELVASLAVAQKQTDIQLRETDRQLKETDRQLKETDLQIKETDRQLKESSRELNEQLQELGRQIGGLGKKFGGFTEGMALPSMEKILRQRFGMEVVSPRVRVRKDGKELQIDVLAYANGATGKAYVVEVKSHAREESVEQLRAILENFRRFFPEHDNKAIYGILAAVDLSAEMRGRILKAGFYVARIREDVFALDAPANFKPKAY
jgi:hypothetical protein